MKINKTITLDVDLISSLEKLNLNVSEYCNEKLWDYVTKMERINPTPDKKKEEIIKQIEDLQKEQEKILKQTELKSQMEEEGISDEKVRFLKSMPINIMVAKDMKMGWKRNFGEDILWSELLELKKKWGY